MDIEKFVWKKRMLITRQLQPRLIFIVISLCIIELISYLFIFFVLHSVTYLIIRFIYTRVYTYNSI